MATTVSDIAGWIKRGQDMGATHIVVVCDTFDYVDYPCFCMSKEEALEKYHNPGEMQRVMEVYNLGGDIQEQLQMRRAFEF